MSDIDTEAADGLKVLDPKRPIREATKRLGLRLRGSVAKAQLGKRRNEPSSAPLSATGGVFVLTF